LMPSEAVLAPKVRRPVFFRTGADALEAVGGDGRMDESPIHLNEMGILAAISPRESLTSARRTEAPGL